ncbi:hypothetical protein [Streptomyces sp. NPDC001282]
MSPNTSFVLVFMGLFLVMTVGILSLAKVALAKIDAAREAVRAEPATRKR